MAQVRKFQSGGKTFKIAGHTFDTSNADDMKLFQELASNPDFGGIAQSVLDNVNDNAYSGTLNMYRTADGKVVSEGELQHVKDKHMSAGTQKATSRKDNAFWNTFKRRSGREWANNMDAFLSEVARRKVAERKAANTHTNTSSDDSKIKITGVGNINDGKWSYNKQNRWNSADINNTAIMREWQLLEDYFNASEEDRKNKYDVSELDNRSLEAYMDMRKNNPNLYNQYKSRFTDGAEKIADNDDFYSTYGWFGFNNGATSETEDERRKSKEEDKIKKTYADKGWDYDKWKDYGIITEDGALELYDNVLGGYSSGNYMFNDYWANSKMNPGEEWLQGYTKIGNRLYKTSDAEKEGSTLYNYLRRRGGFYDMNQTGDYKGSNSLIEWQWGNPYYQTPDRNNIGNFFEGNYQYDPTNLRSSNTAWKGGDLNDGDQIVRYLNMSDDTGDHLGFRTPLYGIVDRSGNLVQSNLKADDFTNLFDGGTKEVLEAQQFLHRQRVSTDKDSPYYNMYKETVGDENDPWFTFYVDPATGNSVMVPGTLFTNKTLGDGVGIKNIGEAIRELFKKKEIQDLMAANPKFQKKLQNTIMSLTGSDWQDLFRGNFNKVKELTDFGLSEEEARTIVEAFYDKGSNSKDAGTAWERKRDYLTRVPSNKNGGILKAQQGTILNAGTKQAKSNTNTETEKVKHTEVGKVPGNNVLSRADVAELISAGADVIGTVTGLFGPIGDVAGSTIGLGASATQLGADISRDGFQIKDLGRFALNAGLDAVGLVPVLGDAARVAKTIKTIKKVSKIVSPLFIGMGLTSAAGSVDKILKGEELTVDDWTNLAAGFQSITNAGVLGKQRYDMSKIASLNSKLPKNTVKPEYKYTIGDKTVVLGEGQIGDVTSKNKKDAQEYLAKLFDGVEEDIPKDLAKKFGFIEGKTRWSKVSEPKQNKQIEDRSIAGFFFRPGLNKYIDSNSGNLKTIIENNDVDSRTAATLIKQYDLDLPLMYTKNKAKWTRYGKINEPKSNESYVYESGNLPQPASRTMLPDFNIKLSRMPWIGPRIERGLVPINSAVSDQGINFRRQARIVEPTTIRRGDIKPIRQPRKPRMIDAPETVTPGIIIDKNGKVVSMDRSQFNRMDKLENNTANLFIRFKQYQQAFRNVNSEKSFNKLLQNLSNDVEFRLAMEENPGILRQEMLEAAYRIGLMGKSRKSQLKYKNLTFKKGGILKAQPGAKFNFDFKPATFSGKIAGFNFDPSLKVDILDPNYRYTTPITEIAAEKAFTGNTLPQGSIVDAYGNISNPANDALSKYTKVRSGAEQLADKQRSGKIADTASVRTDKNSFNWAGLGSDLLEIANATRGLAESRQIYDIDRKMAEITGKRTVKAPNITINRRFMTPTVNQYNDLIGKYNTSIGQNITSDAFANMAARLSGADKVTEMVNNMNREISAEFNNAQDKWNQTWQQQQLYNTDTANQNNQIQVSAALAGEQAKAGKLTRDSDIYNKYLNKAQYQLNNIASVDSQIQDQKYKLGVAKASALAQNRDADISGYDNMLSELDKPQYRNHLLNARRYGITSAKKGTKLRSTNDEMLLNNQKLVARAIEKLNDNTMKLILKALS